MLGIEVWPNAEAAGSYDGEVTYLLNWLNLRIAYLDSVFTNKAQTSTTLVVSARAFSIAAPVTLTATVTGSGGSLTGSVSFLSNGVPLGTTSLTGGVANLTVSLPAGSDSLEAVYSGDEGDAMSASTPQSVTVAVSVGLRFDLWDLHTLSASDW